ncbi:MAG: MFS transporter [Pseudolysinimonas sp.]
MSAAGYLVTSVPLRLASAGSAVALPILAVQRLDDVAVGAALVAASLAPAVVAAPLAGVALDRARRPRLLFFAAALVTVVAFAAGALIGTLPLWLIVVLLVGAGCAAPIYFGGLSSFATDAIPDENRAYAYDALSYNVASVAGPGLVAIIGTAGASGLGMWLMAGAALVGAAGALTMRATPRPVSGHGWVGTVAAGGRHLVGHAPLRLVILTGTLAALGSGALPIVAIGLSIERSGDVHQAALIVTAFAVGGLAGAVLSAIRPGSRFTPQFVMAGGWAAIGLFTLLAVPDLGLVWTVVVIGISGIFTASSNAAMLLLRKLNSPPGVRSQVFTIGSGLRAASGALGAAIAGAAAGLDAGVLVVGIAASWLIPALVMLAYRPAVSRTPRDGSSAESFAT